MWLDHHYMRLPFILLHFRLIAAAAAAATLLDATNESSEATTVTPESARFAASVCDLPVEIRDGVRFDYDDDAAL